MNTNLRIGNTLLATIVACALLACTSQETTPAPTPQDSAVPPAATGLGTLCPLPTQLITDFTYSPTSTSTTEVRFGSGAGTLTGGQSYYPTSANTLKVDVTGNSYHVTGTVGDYSGFGLYFDSCDRIDASAFKGIQFTVSASVPPQGNAITFGVGTIDDKPTGTWMIANGSTSAKETDSGRCTPTSETKNQYYHPGCSDPTAQIPVTAAPTPQPVVWAGLTGGQPVATVNPSEITSIYWYFPWSGTGATPYPIDFILDDLTFIP